MNIKALAIEYGLTAKMLRYFQKHGIVNDELTAEQSYFLKHISLIYDKPEFIKQQVARYNTTKRARLLFGADLNTIEACVLSRWLGHYSDTDYSFNLSVESVVAEIMEYKSLPKSKKQYVTDVAYRMRTKARNLVYRNNSGQLVEKAKSLTAPKKARHRKEEKARKYRRPKNFSQNDLFGY